MQAVKLGAGGTLSILGSAVAVLVVQSQRRCVQWRHRDPPVRAECWTTLTIEVIVISILVALVGAGLVAWTLRK